MSLLLLIFCLPTTQTRADIVQDICQTAQTSADIMRCLVDRLGEAENRLNTLFTEQKNNAEDNANLELSQVQWLSYRDAECDRQKSTVVEQGLQEQSASLCRLMLTRGRIQRLQETGSNLLNEGFSIRPRWENVLRNHQPDIFWQMGTQHNTELNCDGTQDIVIPGIQLSLADDEDSLKTILNAEIAILDNPVIGKPSLSIHGFPISVNPEQNSCPYPLTVEIIEKLPDALLKKPLAPIPDERPAKDVIEILRKAKDIKTPEIPQDNCIPAVIAIQDSACNAHYIQWDGNQYKLFLHRIEEEQE